MSGSSIFNLVVRRLRRVGTDQSGEALVGFAILAPVLVMVCLAILEFSLVVFDFHRASEATRRGGRIVAINSPLIDPTKLLAGGSLTCVSALGAVSCSGVAAVSPAVFDDLILKMQEILPTIAAENVQIEYKDIGLGDATTPGGIIPLVTVKLINLEHPFLMLNGFPGFGPSFTYPPFTTNQVAGGIG